MDLLSIIWNADPVVFSIGSIAVRWYGLLYAVGFLLGITLLSKMLKSEGCPDDWSDKIFIYIVIATIVGARLGHVFFYEWDYYSQNIGEIFYVWHGGLASHGGVIAILFAVWLLARNFKKSMLWIGDRVWIPSVWVGACIRTGNLFNSEIYGHETTLPWGFKFIRNYPEGFPIDQIPACHPTQIYEAGLYMVLFAVMVWMYYKTDAKDREGLFTGIAFAVFFMIRFMVEFIKNDQVAFEANMTLNMGQWLSLPFIIAGIILIIRAYKRPVACK